MRCIAILFFVSTILGLSSTGYTQDRSRAGQAELVRFAPGIRLAGSNLSIIAAQRWAPLTTKVWRTIEAVQNDLVGTLGPIPSFALAVQVLDEERFVRLSGAPRWTQAIFRPGEIMLSFTSADPDGLRVFYRSVRHEYTHAVVHALSGGQAPGWLDEGLAQWAEGQPEESVQEALVSWLIHHRPISLSLLRGGFVKLSPEMVAPAYAQSLAATNYLLARFGAVALQRFFCLLRSNIERNAAFERAFSVSEHDFEAQFAALF